MQELKNSVFIVQSLGMILVFMQKFFPFCKSFLHPAVQILSFKIYIFPEAFVEILHPS